MLRVETSMLLFFYEARVLGPGPGPWIQWAVARAGTIFFIYFYWIVGPEIGFKMMTEVLGSRI